MSKKQELIDINNDELRFVDKPKVKEAKQKDFPKSIFFVLFSLPIILFLLSISENSKELINNRIKVFLSISLVISLLFLVY